LRSCVPATGLAQLRAVLGAAGDLQPAGAPGTEAVPGHAARDVRLALALADGNAGAARSRLGAPGTTGDRDSADRIAALVTLAQRGDAEAFADIYDAYVDAVFRYVLYRVGSRPLAEDITSETFLRAWRRIGSFTWQGRDIGAWFVTIARNLVTDHVKSSRFRLEVSTADMLDADRADDGIEDTVVARIRDAALIDALRRLKPEQQECLVLRFLQELSVAETAAVMGRSEGAIKQLQLRAVRALAELLPEEAR
jgi:RNA polymerase sigma-70 factor (ECF subfamily)